LGCSLISALLAPTYFFSLFAYLAAAPAVVLGFAACGVPDARNVGRLALAITCVACGVATVTLTLVSV